MLVLLVPGNYGSMVFHCVRPECVMESKRIFEQLDIGDFSKKCKQKSQNNKASLS